MLLKVTFTGRRNAGTLGHNTFIPYVDGILRLLTVDSPYRPALQTCQHGCNDFSTSFHNVIRGQQRVGERAGSHSVYVVTG